MGIDYNVRDTMLKKKKMNIPKVYEFHNRLNEYKDIEGKGQ